MNVLTLGRRFGRKVARVAVEKAPLGMLIVSMGGIAYGTYKFCKKSPTAKEIIDEFHEEKQGLKDFMNDPQYEDARVEKGYGKKEYRKEMIVLHVKLVWNMIRLMALPTAIIFLSMLMGFWSHGIMVGRVAGLTTALTTVEAKFNRYRENVRADGGEELDEKYLYSKSVEAMESYEVNDEGEEEQVIKQAEIVESNDIFDIEFSEETSKHWSKSDEYNRHLFYIAQGSINGKMHNDNWVTMHEIAKELGIRPEFILPQWLYSGCYSENKGTEPLDQIVIKVIQTWERDDNGRNTHKPSYILRIVQQPIVDLRGKM